MAAPREFYEADSLQDATVGSTEEAAAMRFKAQTSRSTSSAEWQSPIPNRTYSPLPILKRDAVRIQHIQALPVKKINSFGDVSTCCLQRYRGHAELAPFAEPNRQNQLEERGSERRRFLFCPSNSSQSPFLLGLQVWQGREFWQFRR